MKAQLPMQYEHYIFDLYGTLADLHTEEDFPSLWEKMSLLFGYHGAHYDAGELRGAWQGQIQAATREAIGPFPEIDLADVIRILYENKGVAPDQELIGLTGACFRMLTTEYIHLYPGAAKLLDTLRQEGKHIWLLSNAQRIFIKYELRLLDIESCFDGILLSSDYGMRKPDPRYFAELKNQFGVDFSRSLFIGNDVQADIVGAQHAGMDTFYVESDLLAPQEKPSATYTAAAFAGWI